MLKPHKSRLERTKNAKKDVKTEHKPPEKDIKKENEAPKKDGKKEATKENKKGITKEEEEKFARYPYLDDRPLPPNTNPYYWKDNLGRGMGPMK